jgi:hypothetical protein
MRPKRRGVLSLGVAAVLAASSLAGSGWTQETIAGDPLDVALYDVSASSATEAWAVGELHGGPFAVHWDGIEWQGMAPFSAGLSFFNGVASIAVGNAWAVGWGQDGAEPQQGVIQHWDGAGWSAVPAPGTFDGSRLYSVDATSATDVWAVGSYDVTNTARTLIDHYDGVSWTVVPSPNRPGGSVLTSVSALSPTDVWAVGTRNGSVGDPKTLVEHYDGVSWTVVPSPNPGPHGNFPEGVSASGPHDVWMAGYTTNAATTRPRPFIEHWDGLAWSVATLPALPGATDALLRDVAAPSSHRAWAVGFAIVDGRYRTLIERWDGAAWRVEPSPNPGRSPGLEGVTAVSSRAWAVGSTGPRPLILRHD